MADYKWEKVVYPENKLWMNTPHFYKSTPDDIHSMDGLGDPELLVEIYKRYQSKPSDVHIVSYPKAGTTWMEEIVYILNNNLDFAGASKKLIDQRSVFIELYHDKIPTHPLNHLEEMEEPRMIKWHHAATLLPKEAIDHCKVIYLARNPKDLCLSFYHFNRMNNFFGFTGDFNQFFELFLKGKVPYGHYWFNNLSYWKLRDRSNVLFVMYENMKKDLVKEIRSIADFLGKPVTMEEAEKLAECTSFDSMKNNPMVSYEHWDQIGLRNMNEAKFFRKGTVGDWKNTLSEEQSHRLDEYVEKHLGGTGLSFTYQL